MRRRIGEEEGCLFVTLGPKYSLITSPSTKVTGKMIIPQVCSMDVWPVGDGGRRERANERGGRRLKV